MFQASFYQHLGQGERAAELLRALLATDPENERAQRTLDQIEQAGEQQ